MTRLNRSKSRRTRSRTSELQELCNEDVQSCVNRLESTVWKSLENLRGKSRGEPLRVLTHCNAGWLATVDWGTALAPIYMAFDAGIPIHVWVDETRPRNQGAHLTAWELGTRCSTFGDCRQCR